MNDFSIHRFLDLAGGVKIDDLDWDLCARIGVSDAEARILRYMGDTESHTILYMRDLLAGHSTRDPDVVNFLSAWVYEELCHGRAITKLLDVCGRPEAPTHYTQTTESASVREFIEAALSHALAYATPRFVAVHMTWGAINEATAAAAYQNLEKRTANPVLATLLNRMARQERRHMAFYYHQARKRMEGEPRTQALVRFAIKRFWTLVGSGVAGSDNLAYTAAHLFPDAAARAPLEAAERQIRELPGLEGFDMLTQQTAAAAASWARAHGEADFRSNDAEARAALAQASA